MSQQWGPGPGTGAPGPGYAPAPPAPRRRWGIWVAVGCLALFPLPVLIATIGGVVYLVNRDGGGSTTTTSAAPTTATAEGSTFTIDYPSTWESASPDEISTDSGMEVDLRRTEGRTSDDTEEYGDSVVVYQFDSDKQAVAECRFQSAFLGFDFDSSEDAQELEVTELAGRSAAHFRVVGTRGGKDAVTETWCLDVDGGVLQVVAETYGATELSAEEQEIVASLEVTAG